MAALSLLALASAGCGPIVKPASFMQRPDSVKRGSMLGPFSGRVVDADTGQPIDDAVIWASWAFARGVGSSAPEAMRSRWTKPDADGNYRLRALRDLPAGLSTRLVRFALVVYRKGYVGYRSDGVFGRGDRRRFSQLRNTVKLARWSSELSHARHLVFLGGGRPIQQASAWEALAAAAELAGAKRGAASTDVFSALSRLGKKHHVAATGQAKLLLTSDEARAVTGYTGALVASHLATTAGDATDTLHLRAVDRPERYDIAVRLWRLKAAPLAAKYDAVLRALPGSKQRDHIADRAFVVTQGEILGIGFLHRDSNSIVLLTCGKGQCTTDKQLLDLAKRVEGNLRRLPPLAGADAILGEPK